MAERDRRYRVVRVFRGTRQELDISSTQARKIGISRPGESRPTPSVAYLLDGVFAWHGKGDRTDTVCPRCGTSQREIILYRRVGCSHCYEEFDGTVERLLHLHRNDVTHTGRLPQRLVRYRQMFFEREELLNRLSAAVQNEEFETAASLRDRLDTFTHDDADT